jgi:hypothetical protein
VSLELIVPDMGPHCERCGWSSCEGGVQCDTSVNENAAHDRLKEHGIEWLQYCPRVSLLYMEKFIVLVRSGGMFAAMLLSSVDDYVAWSHDPGSRHIPWTLREVAEAQYEAQAGVIMINAINRQIEQANPDEVEELREMLVEIQNRMKS